MTQGCFCFTNVYKVLPDRIVEEDLYVQNGVFVAAQQDAQKVDCHGAYVAPGLIDLQINGLHGIDFTTHPEKIADACAILPQYGVSSFLATILSQPLQGYKDLSKKLPKERANGANFLGLHFEGPFIEAQFAGAHPVSFVTAQCKNDLYEDCVDETRLVTLAPELPGALELISWLTKRGVRVAAGHTGADIATLEEAQQRGLSLTTHLFNAMAPFHHRKPGIIGYTLGSQKLYYSLIADGVHLAKEAIELAMHAYPEGMVLVSDASARLGSDTGTVAGVPIADDQLLAGSRSSLFDAVCHLVELGATLPFAISSATLRPAAFLGIQDKKGMLTEGCDADFILMSKNLKLLSTYIGGKICYRSSTP